MKNLTKKGNTIFFTALIVGLAVIMAFFSTCRKDKKEPPLINQSYQIMTNPDDPLIFKAMSIEGQDIEFYGQRDNNGLPLKIDLAIVYTSEDTCKVYYDANNRPVEMVANKSRFSFEWISDTKANVTFYAADGLFQHNTEIDFSSNLVTQHKVTGENKASLTRIKKPLRIASTVSNYNKSKVSATNSYNCSIDVFKCGTPYDASVFVIAKNKTGGSPVSLPAFRITEGRYGAMVPKDLAWEVNPCDVVKKVASTADLLCAPFSPKYFSIMEIQFAKASIPILAVYAAQISTGLGLLTVAYPAMCSAYSGLKGGCAAGLSRQFEEIEIYAVVEALPFDIRGPIQTATKGTPIPPLNVSLPANPSINKFDLTPGAPQEGQDYTVQVEAFCIPAGATLVMSVKGTDGYSDSKSAFIDIGSAKRLFTLIVPGADSGIQDEISVLVTLPDGSKIQRQASIVFGG